ncbi:MAG: hypothetical protein JRH18_00505 [Deltaproteobacteria bacterium]|nr:hypothetical protein [Deltaproteobacteria bacterium]MBW1962912.1 hypothetical protein [Deltaproteobacteria bacterium]MBW2150127.1 hypothetical protein [Deltaproteobacteria bacterium]
MSKSAQRPWQAVPAESEPFNYISSTLKYFIESIKQRTDERLLDGGPVYRQNINFFSQRVHKLYVCDLFRRLSEDREAKLPAEKYWHYLDYPLYTFDGILLWNLIDRLDDPEVKSLVKRCYGMMKPGGFVMLFTLGNQVSPTGQDTFAIHEGFRLVKRERKYPHLPARQRQNRDFLFLLDPFIPVKSLIYRNGIREFLFQRS